MRGNLLIRLFIAGLLSISLLSCSTRKKSAVPAGRTESSVSRSERSRILDQVATHRHHFVTFNGRAKSKIEINRSQYDVTANIRIESDKAIWISVTALMGIEAARVLITPDSVKIVNRLEGEYVSQPYAYLHKLVGNELSFSALQQLLTGNVIDSFSNEEPEIRTNGKHYSLHAQAGDLEYTARLNTDFRPESTELNHAARQQRMEVTYSDYRTTGEHTFPNRMKISVLAEQLKLLCEIQYNRVAYDDSIAMPFAIPARYQEMP